MVETEGAGQSAPTAHHTTFIDSPHLKCTKSKTRSEDYMSIPPRAYFIDECLRRDFGEFWVSKKRCELLTEAQWELIGLLLPEPKRRKDKRAQACLEGTLWVLETDVAGGSAGAVPVSGDLLATVEVMGRTGCVAGRMASAAGALAATAY